MVGVTTVWDLASPIQKERGVFIRHVLKSPGEMCVCVCMFTYVNLIIYIYIHIYSICTSTYLVVCFIYRLGSSIQHTCHLVM